MAKRLEVMNEDELNSHPVLNDVKHLSEDDLIKSYEKKHKSKSWIKEIIVIAILLLIALLYLLARLRL